MFRSLAQHPRRPQKPASLRLTPALWDRDLLRLQIGFVHLYWQRAGLEEAIDRLTVAGYRVIRFDMSSGTSSVECLRDSALRSSWPGSKRPGSGDLQAASTNVADNPSRRLSDLPSRS